MIDMGRTQVTKEDFSIDELRDEILSEEDGAVVVFNGVVRGFNEGKAVSNLEVERYEDMTIQELEKVKEEALLNFDVNDITVIHRYGMFEVGDDIVCIVVTASHRKPAFQACEYCIDRLKERVPLWKKETTENGEKKWVEEPE